MGHDMSSMVNETLGRFLHRHAEVMPRQTAFTFLSDGEDIKSSVTYGELHAQAQVIAQAIMKAGLTGKTVALLHPPGGEFISAFCACLMAGAIAVPLQSPTTRRLHDRALAVMHDCSAAAVLTTVSGAVYAERVAAEFSLPMVITDGLETSSSRMGDVPVQPHWPAVLQYTSGSTGSPKGVIITHSNLVCNSSLIGQVFATRPGDVGVNWLPLLHDMGLIGNVVHVIHQGIHCVHMSPQSMIRKPSRWLRAIARFGGTMSGGPDFAWRLLAERVRPEELADLDLSQWRVAYTGAEQVRPSTLGQVAELLSPTGFAEQSFLPCYGMAEATLIVSGGPNGRMPLVSHPRGAGGRSTGYVSCGHPAPAGSVAIVDPETGTRRDDREIGEVWVTGPHIAAGYWNKEGITEEVFHARLQGDPRSWLRTGDLGFLAGDELHICGRIKDVLVVHGRKHHPEDLEATVQRLVPGCASGVAAAFQIDVAGEPRLVIAIEIGNEPLSAGPVAQCRMEAEIGDAVWANHELRVDEIVIVRLGRLPRTTSGKVRRSETRDLYAADRLAGTISNA